MKAKMSKRNISPDEWVHRCFGLTPHYPQFHTLQTIYSYIVVIALCASMYLTPSLTGLTEYNTRINVDIYNLQIKFTFAWSLAAIGLSYFGYHPGLELIEDLKEIDILSDYRMKRQFPVRLAIELTYMSGLCAMEVSISYPSSNVSLATLLFVNMYHGFTVLKVLIDHYTRHIKSVAKRFIMATDKLKEGDFATAVTVHSKLVNCAAKVSKVFGLEILLVLSVESCLIVYNLYNFRSLLESFQKDNKGTSLFIFISILWLVSWFSDIWNIVSTTEDILEQSKTFNKSLLKQIIEDSTGELAKNEKVKLHIAMKKEVSVTAYGFFKIDGSFLYNLAAVTTTYLVILTQFKGKGKAD